MKINKNTTEQSSIQQLIDRHGYEYFCGSDIAPYSDNQQRDSLESFVLEGVLKESIGILKETLSELSNLTLQVTSCPSLIVLSDSKISFNLK